MKAMHTLHKKFLNGNKFYHDHLSPGNIQPAEEVVVKGLEMRVGGEGGSDCIIIQSL